jgi:putative DNA primase/helicase
MAAPDMPAVAAMLADRITELAPLLMGAEPTSRTRTEWRYGTRGGFSIVIAGEKRGAWYDYATCKGGDPLGLVAERHATPMRAAWEWSLGFLGLRDGAAPSLPRRRPVTLPAPPRVAAVSSTLEMSRRIWAEAGPAAGTLVERTYLPSRGLALPDDAPIRFHPDCPRAAERWPAMLALMTDPLTDEPVGVHRTFLARDGRGKAPGPLPAKMMCGAAGIVRLTPDEDVTLGLGIAEGIETSLSVMQLFDFRPVWAATSAGAIRSFPILPGIEALTIFADPDGAGMEAAQACVARWREAGREARIIAPPGAADFNDMLRGAA